jgi:hypothetical protein
MDLSWSREVVKCFHVCKQHVIRFSNVMVGYNWNGILLDNDVTVLTLIALVH